MRISKKVRLCCLAAAALIACSALTACSGKSTSASTTAASASVAESDANAGTCGEGVTWELTDGVITISGEGRMTNFSTDAPAPWADMSDQITTVNVEGTVTAIGVAAFKDCTALTTVEIADGVQYIEAGAFNGCTALTTANIPESVTYIKAGAFKNCDALAAVTLRANCRLDQNVFPSTVEVSYYNG